MQKQWQMRVVIACWVVLSSVVVMGNDAASGVTGWHITPTSLVSHEQLQNVNLSIECGQALVECSLRVWSGDRLLAEKPLGDLRVGANEVSVLLREPARSVQTRWALMKGASTLAEKTLTWNPPRHWTLYVIKSAHVDIGLHDSQYKQRHMTVDFIDQARRLIDRTADWPQASRDRYVVEGMWWWRNYPRDRSEQAAGEIAEQYVRAGVVDIGASHAGNHTQVYGLEELCRSAYTIRELRRRWGAGAETMIMADNNGITWPLVNAYAAAGLKHLAFFPNAWNPKTVGGSRIEVGWDSKLPHLFYWQGPDPQSRLLVWTGPHYIHSTNAFGIGTSKTRTPGAPALQQVAEQMTGQLALLESRYPYDVWLLANYDDNETPNLRFSELAKAWNARWRWPQLRTVGELSEPFREVEQRFGDQIPTLSGDITGGWAQHPVSTPPLLALKRQADRLLPVAEKLATLARLVDPEFIYPAAELDRAWEALICNDEHGYGVSYYKGRPVYDTWMQKRDWIQRSLATAQTQSDRALAAIADRTPTEGPSVFVFNPTLQPRAQTVEIELPPSCAELRAVRSSDGSALPAAAEKNTLRFRTSQIPPMGYATYALTRGQSPPIQRRACDEPPVVENTFYRVTFSSDGAIAGIYDKQLQRELVDASAPYRCNQFVYTRDAHKTFTTPTEACFEIETSPLGQTVIARMDDPVSGAAIEQRVTLPAHEKRIDLDNRLDHVRDLGRPDRWNRFGYYAFPFDVPDGEFYIGLNGCAARPRVDQTGHGTEAYMAARDWSDVRNDRFGVTLVQHDSCLIECGKIHADKKAFGEPPTGSHLYSYVLNDWLYAHAYITGPSHINLRYRYAIRSHAGAWADAGAASFAERLVTPMPATVIDRAQQGVLPAAAHSFISTDAAEVSLLTLKMSQSPGRGVIARFHETAGRPAQAVNLRVGWGKNLRLTRCSLIEQDLEPLDHPVLRVGPFGYTTLRIQAQTPPPSAAKLAVGECTDKAIALRWSPVAGAVQYNVYRGELADFEPDEYHRLTATRQPAHIDDWLSPDSTYYYRVAAVSADANQGDASQPVGAMTRPAGDSAPAKVGTVYTGLISDPRAWRGDEPDTLYLQWGQNAESDVVGYELYRGERPDFELNADSLVAKVPPGPYVVTPFEDKGLKPHTTYFYRVLAVDRDGRKSQPSEVCQGITREMASPADLPRHRKD